MGQTVAQLLYHLTVGKYLFLRLWLTVNLVHLTPLLLGLLLHLVRPVTGLFVTINVTINVAIKVTVSVTINVFLLPPPVRRHNRGEVQDGGQGLSLGGLLPEGLLLHLVGPVTVSLPTGGETVSVLVLGHWV